MKLKAIYASKLYKSSSRKEAIKAAISNPINMELVSQLDEYLDDEYLDETDDEQAEPTKGLDLEKSDKEETTSEEQKPEQKEEKEVPKRSGAKITRSTKSQNETSETSESTESSEEQSKQIETPKEETTEEQSDTNSSIKASEQLWDKILPIQMIIETLKSTEDTSLVERAEVKEDKKEFWVYYNDSVNLNDIMNSVIELLNASGYSYLKFNRLARSDNAIVFEILPYSNPMEPDIQDDSEEIEGLEIGESQVEEN